jgi:hypothetical protein
VVPFAIMEVVPSTIAVVVPPATTEVVPPAIPEVVPPAVTEEISLVIAEVVHVGTTEVDQLVMAEVVHVGMRVSTLVVTGSCGAGIALTKDNARTTEERIANDLDNILKTR